jgi:hypothetical protein
LATRRVLAPGGQMLTACLIHRGRFLAHRLGPTRELDQRPHASTSAIAFLNVWACCVHCFPLYEHYIHRQVNQRQIARP